MGTIPKTRNYWAGKARAILLEQHQLNLKNWLRIFQRLVKDVNQHASAIADPREPGGAELDPREPLVWSYVTLLGMPRHLRQDYKGLKEFASGKGLTDGHDAIRAAGYLFKEIDTAHTCRLEWLARLVRTLDADLAGFHFGPMEGEEWKPEQWRVPGYPCSLVPIDRSHRLENEKPFERRGLANHAMIPAALGDVTVRLHLHSAIDSKARQTTSHLRNYKAGTAIFPALTVDIEIRPAGFLVSGVQNNGGAFAMRRHVEQAVNAGCDVLLWPELCVPPEEIVDLVKYLGDTAVTKPGKPSLMVPGSWHVELEDGKFRNRLVALDAFGEKVVDEYDKRNKFQLGDRFEDIEPGEAVSILVMEDRLVAFGICLDFCDDGPPLFYEHLDIDLVMVPSMGEYSTMASHLRHIPQQHSVHAARVVVAQQVPVVSGKTRAEAEPPGYSILSPVAAGQESASKHRQTQGFRAF